MPSTVNHSTALTSTMIFYNIAKGFLSRHPYFGDIQIKKAHLTTNLVVRMGSFKYSEMVMNLYIQKNKWLWTTIPLLVIWLSKNCFSASPNSSFNASDFHFMYCLTRHQVWDVYESLLDSQGWWWRSPGIMPRPRGNDWLEDEIKQLRLNGVNTIISLLESEEILALGLACLASHTSGVVIGLQELMAREPCCECVRKRK